MSLSSEVTAVDVSNGDPHKWLPQAVGGFYRPELDGLRFFAFLAVFMSHGLPALDFWVSHAGSFLGSWMAAFVRAGRFGVDLFFVLSAYLITEILLREKRARNGVNVKAFWVRRILRIWPLYFVFVGAVLWLGPHIVPGESVTPAYQIGFVTFTANWVVALGGWQPSVLMPLWSISIEEQFYLTWPLVVRRLSPQRILILSAILVGIAVLFRTWLISTNGDGLAPIVWCNTLTRLDPIAIGTMLAIILAGRSPSVSPWTARIMLVVPIAIIGAASRYDDIFTKPLLGSLAYTIIAGACACMVAAALSLSTGSWLAKRGFVYLGRISYGAYVFHVFAQKLVVAHMPWLIAGLPGVVASLAQKLTPLISFALTISLAAASYRWLETPFLRLKTRFSAIR